MLALENIIVVCGHMGAYKAVVRRYNDEGCVAVFIEGPAKGFEYFIRNFRII